MHNDLPPRAGLEANSYGPALREQAGQAYVELDLYVPELVLGQEASIQEPWYPLAERAVGPDRALLHTRGPRSFVLLLPTTARE